MDDVVICEAPYHMYDGGNFTDMTEELISQPFTLGSTLYQPGYIAKLYRRVNSLPGLVDVRQHLEPFVRNRYNSDVGFDSAERVVGSFCTSLCNCVKKCTLAHVR